jgi:hypothetical protein
MPINQMPVRENLKTKKMKTIKTAFSASVYHEDVLFKDIERPAARGFDGILPCSYFVQETQKLHSIWIRLQMKSWI